jgi:hypothetical protein
LKITKKLESILGHGKVSFHFLVKSLGAFPNLAAAAPTLHCDTQLEFRDTFAVQLDRQILLT